MKRLVCLGLGLVMGCGGSTEGDPSGSDTGGKDSAADTLVVDSSGGDSTSTDSTSADSASADSSAESSPADSTASDAPTEAALDSASADSTAADSIAADTGDVGGDGGAGSGCATGATASQVFGATMVGCAGKVSYASRASLCGAGRVACGARWWTSLRKGKNPTYNYWVDEPLKYSGSATACSVSATAGTSCATDSPMRVCSGISDPLGNTCTWERCGLETTTPNEYFGGCSGAADKTAGTLCCAPPCAAGAPSEVFGDGMFGCAGKVTYDKGKSLCGAGYHVCAATEWTSKRSGAAPKHHYWTADNLRYSGTAGACTVSTTTGSVCDSGTNPMRVCTGTGTAAVTDPEGNVCNWVGCGLTSTTSEYFGGCVGNTTAGALCCAD
ncbi:MAG: hypothetical protein IPJ34_05535 [Myxococcales bacterium]|nr:hypothetical protein [Myxococcales bacterium]